MQFISEGDTSGTASARSRSNKNLRVSDETRELIDTAAALFGKSRTAFIIDSAREDAVNALLDQKLFSLDEAIFEKFQESLQEENSDKHKLESLLKTKPVWDR